MLFQQKDRRVPRSCTKQYRVASRPGIGDPNEFTFKCPVPVPELDKSVSTKCKKNSDCNDKQECNNGKCVTHSTTSTVTSEGVDFQAAASPADVVKPINPCTIPGTCHKNANCYNSAGVAKCVCKPGYTGDGKKKCEIPTPVDPCDINNGGCDPNANCKSTAAGVKCVCKDDYRPAGTKCIKKDREN